jgi:hypothetical protein
VIGTIIQPLYVNFTTDVVIGSWYVSSMLGIGDCRLTEKPEFAQICFFLGGF